MGHKDNPHLIGLKDWFRDFDLSLRAINGVFGLLWVTCNNQNEQSWQIILSIVSHFDDIHTLDNIDSHLGLLGDLVHLLIWDGQPLPPFTPGHMHRAARGAVQQILPTRIKSPKTPPGLPPATSPAQLCPGTFQ